MIIDQSIFHLEYIKFSNANGRCTSIVRGQSTECIKEAGQIRTHTQTSNSRKLIEKPTEQQQQKHNTKKS